MSGKNIWIGNLPGNITDAGLKELFSPFGEIISCKVMSTSRGRCGMVQFGSADSAGSAILSMDGYKLDGQSLICHSAYKDFNEGGPNQGIRGNPQPSPFGGDLFACNVWVGNLPSTFTDTDLQSLMSAYGNVTSVKMLKATGAEIAGMVNFSSLQEAAGAVSGLNGYTLPGNNKPLIVRYANKKTTSPAGSANAFSAFAIQAPQHSRYVPPQSTFSTSNTNVWIGNLPKNFTDSRLNSLVCSFGTVTSTKMLRDRVTHQEEGAAMVNFSRSSEAAMAVQALNGFAISGHDKPLVAKLAVAKSSAPAGVPPTSFRQATPPSFTISNTNLWVGNLPAGFTEQDVATLFGEFGTIVAMKLLKDKQAHIQEGAAMVNFSSPAEAASAVEALNNQLYPGTEKPLLVRYASHKQQQQQQQAMAPMAQPPWNMAGRGSVGFPPMAEPPGDNVWIGNLPVTFTEGDLHTLFSAFGTVVQSVLLKNKATSENSGAAMVRLGSPAQAIAAVTALNGYSLDPMGKPLEVRFASRKSKEGPGPIHANVNNAIHSFHPYR